MTRKISQREARLLRKRVHLLERRVNINVSTPRPRWEILSFQADEYMMRQVQQARHFGLAIRFEEFGDTFKLFAYQEETT